MTAGILTAELPASLEEITAQMALAEAELNRQRWAADPDTWARERLGDTLWSGQRKILCAVRDNRKVAAPTCHEIGKSYDAAILAAWWIDIHKLGEAFVVTTAPTQPQVEVILWKEIGRAHSRGNLVGRVNTTEWKADVTRVGPSGVPVTKEEIVAMGRKPNDYSPTAFQGIHAPYVLILVDEANGVRGLWNALSSLMANDNSKIVAIGNPDDPSGEFYEACKPGSGWTVVHVSAFESPNFTGEPMPADILRQLVGRLYVEECRAKWARSWHWVDKDGARVEPEKVGERGPATGVKCVPSPDSKLEDTHPFWQSKVLGQFPVQTQAGSLIPLTWIRAAQERSLPPVGENELGLDVGASEDGDPSCLGHRRGPVFRVLYEERQPDTMKTTGKLLQHLLDAVIGATRAKVDYIGVGRGVVDRSREQSQPVYPISVGEKATIVNCLKCRHQWDQALLPEEECPKCGSDLVQPVFANLLSQLWWFVRGLFESGEIDIDSEDTKLAEELLSMRWQPNSKGQTVVSYSDGPSPNRADSLLITFAPVHEVVVAAKDFVSW